jgi:putative effector of murein hydrolase LrgA (UPF0299 family)
LDKLAVLKLRHKYCSSKMGYMQPANIRRIFIVAGVISLFISYLGIWIRLINDPVERTGSDFIAFYTAGRIANSEGIASVYHPALQQQVQQEEVGFPLAQGQVLLYNHLPFLIPLLQVIVNTNYVASFYRWIILLGALYLIGITVLSQTLKRAEIDRSSTLLTAVGAILFLPVFFSLMNGQDTAFHFLGAAIWMYGLLSGREYLAGFGLSLATVRPHIALLLAIPMLFRYRKVFVGFLLGSGILALFSFLILGTSGIKQFIDILFVSAGGEWFGMKENAMYNLIGLLTRAVPQLEAGVIRTLGWIVYGIAVIGLCILWFKTRDLKNGHIGLSIILTLFFVPHLHFHDLALLLIPIYELILRSKEPGYLKTSIAILMPIAISLVLLISNASYYLQYTIPYLIMFMLAAYPVYQRFKMPVRVSHHVNK